MTYGNKIPASESSPVRDVIEAPSAAPAGNVVLAIGREIGPATSRLEKIAHVVLTPYEALAYAGQVLDLALASIAKRIADGEVVERAPGVAAQVADHRRSRIESGPLDPGYAAFDGTERRDA